MIINSLVTNSAGGGETQYATGNFTANDLITPSSGLARVYLKMPTETEIGFTPKVLRLSNISTKVVCYDLNASKNTFTLTKVTAIITKRSDGNTTHPSVYGTQNSTLSPSGLINGDTTKEGWDLWYVMPSSTYWSIQSKTFTSGTWEAWG